MYVEKFMNQIPMNSGWASDEEFAASGCVVGKWSCVPEEGGVVLSSQGDDVVCDGGEGCRSVLIDGGTGSGKTRRIYLPSLLRTMVAKVKRSLVVYDVKGEIEKETRDVAVAENYDIMKIDFRKPGSSDRWNPLGKANSCMAAGNSELAWKLAEDMMAIVFCDGENTKMDAFWRNSSASIFRACCDLLWSAGKDVTFEAVMKLVDTIPADSSRDRRCELFNLIDAMPADSLAPSAISAARNCSDTTRGNILAAFRGYVSCLTSRRDVLKMISCRDSIQFQRIGLKPTVLYVSLPDDSIATGVLQGMLLKQLEQELNECAMKHGGTLPVQTDIYIDELCNIRPALASLPSAVTICRSRGMRYVLAIQSYAQLESVYGSAAEIIAANCATWIAVYVPKDEAFREKLSALCGRNVLGDLLITPSQLADIPMGSAVVIRERCHPYYTSLQDVSEVKARLAAASAPERGPTPKAA